MTKRVEVELTNKLKINHDCYIFSFRFVEEKIHFTIGQFVKFVKVLPTYDHPEGE